MTTKKTASKQSRKRQSLKVERLFDASAKTLWSYWADPEKFAKWFNPAPGMALVVHEYDVRPGGRVRFDMPQPDGNPNPQEGVFHTLRPYTEMVSGAPDKSFLIAVRFTPVGKRTRMTVTVTGVPAEFHEGATKGWNAGFDKLAGLLVGDLALKGFTIERTFKTSPAKMWELWTTKEGVESWWGPEGFATKVKTLDLRPGGTFEYEMKAVGAEQIAALKELGLPLTTHARNVYAEVIPPRRLVLTSRIDFVPGTVPYDITMTVEFQSVRGGTQIVFTSTKMHNAQFGELARQGQEEQFGKLARLVAGLGPSGGVTHATEIVLHGDREVRISRVFDAPRQRVFRAHTDPKLLERWWGPRGYATRVEIWDVRPGGGWRIVQHSPDGAEHGFRGVFQAVAPPEQLTWTFEYEGTPGHVLTQTTTFEDMPGGRTKLTVRALYKNREDRDAMLAAGMEWGLRQGYERLDEMLVGGE